MAGRALSLGRRTVLAAAAAGALAACTAPTPSPPAPTALAPEPTTPAPPTPAPTNPAPTPTPALPTRAEIEARYAGRAPTAFGLDVAGTVLDTPGPALALTFDACGGPHGSGVDHALLDLLRGAATPATLFLNQRWIEANEDLARELAADPLFELADHGTRHLPLSVTGAAAYKIPGTASPGEVYDEVMGVQPTLAELTGTPSPWVRSGTAHADDVAIAILGDLGLRLVNFSVNVDEGATAPAARVTANALTLQPGGIAISHMNQPAGGTAAGWAAALPRLRDAGRTFALLRELL